MSKLNKISDNDLFELSDLIGRINHLIEEYSHVSDLLSKPFIRAFENEQFQIEKQREKREL